MSNLTLVPSYWASVSGGKDSLYMLKVILSNLDKYPLSAVVHFELEIDYPFIKDVINYMENECKNHNIPFYRIKPRLSWNELYDKYGFPTRKARWCNSKYKLDSFRQLKAFMKSKGYSVYTYIGYCADEVKRFCNRNNIYERYPLVEENISEMEILSWARNIPLFNDYYKYNTRCGCMYCPMASYINLAYLYKYYPSNYEFMMNKVRETENIRSIEYGRPFSVLRGNANYNVDYVDNMVRNVYINKLSNMENQISIFDL